MRMLVKQCPTKANECGLLYTHITRNATTPEHQNTKLLQPTPVELVDVKRGGARVTNDRHETILKEVLLSANQHQNGKPSATMVDMGNESDRPS